MPVLSRLDAGLRRMPISRRLGLALQHVATLRRTRRSLALLDDHLLADIGLTPYEARTEAMRPVWDVPAHWRD